MYKIILKFLLITYFLTFESLSEVVKKIEIIGNERITNETIQIFNPVSVNEVIDTKKINLILKELYETNFFEDVKISFNQNILKITVKEFPIIQNLNYNGIKAQKIRDVILKDLSLNERSSFNKLLLNQDTDKIISNLKTIGYYFATAEVFVEELGDNLVNINYEIDLGEKARIQKISFIGNKVYKDRKLRRVILSEEYKFWKFISGKKFLNEELIQYDSRLLKNFFLNKGFYNVKINSSFAKLIENNEFELIFNIDAGRKINFGSLELELPNDYANDDFVKLRELFKDLTGQPYSINSLDKILEEIDKVALDVQYETVKVDVIEKLIDDELNLRFILEDTKKFLVERINIFGNNITQESVIRNQLALDEGDVYNEILANKTVNNLKSLNYFKTVTSEVKEGTKAGNKIINLSIEEKPTGEISASAGVGTSGNTIGAGISENNFLGKGIRLLANLSLSTDTVRGRFSVTNPNFLNTEKLIYTTVESSETDKLTDFGYKTTRTGFIVGTKFEYLDDFKFGIGTSNYYEKIDTDVTASARQKTQEGNYWDTFLKLDFDYDKRNQKFQTSDGFRGYYSVDLPVVSETNSLRNVYNYKYFTELYDENISTFSLFLSAVNSLSSDDVKLSERLNIPSSKLRGFEFGKIGPKDGEDFIGGNYITAVSFSSTLPQILENSQNTDFLLFLDVANIWGVDYDSSLSDSNKIRSAAGIAVDWFTPVGPLNFSLSQPISKAPTDKTESFRFNLGTTF